MNPIEQAIAGALFDFAGFLTTRTETIEVGSFADASPLVELLTEWAETRDLSLDDPQVESWRSTLESHQQAAQDVGLPPLSPHDHPEPHTMVWSALELQAIRAYARAAIEAHQARQAFVIQALRNSVWKCP